MKPVYPSDSHDDFSIRTGGWKLFYATLLFIQIIGVGVLWRTYDSISSMTEKVQLNAIRIEQIIVPAIARNDDRIDRLERSLSRSVGTSPN